MSAATEAAVITAGNSPLEAGLDPSRWNRSLFEALIDANRGKGDAVVVEDHDKTPLTRKRLMLGACVLGRRLATMTAKGERVGVLLPNVSGAAVTFFALSAYGRVPAMLNFSAGLKSLEAALTAADIKVIVTSRIFVQTLKLEEVVAALSQRAKIVYLEAVRKEISTTDKLYGAAYAKLPGLFNRFYKRRPEDVAAVLFTSGTEGVPKGVALSNANILANITQILKLYQFQTTDTIFNALPVFHSFGLTAGLLLPALGGFKSFLYPSPLHYKQIPEFIRYSRPALLLATDTFATGWGKAGAPEDFTSVRLTIMGAEKVKDATRALWRERYGIELNEGYGATECSPVIAVNYPGHTKEGTVGPLLPGIEARLEPVPGLVGGGRLFVRGPNVMLGYFKVDKPGVLQPKDGDWHDTGDIVSLEDGRFIAIRGRAKRFAKIGGEMISLAAIEAYAAAIWPDNSHAVVSVPDPRKGEALVLVTDCSEATVDPMSGYARTHGIPELAVPKKIVKVESLPVLGTGKVDLVSIEAIARQA